MLARAYEWQVVHTQQRSKYLSECGVCVGVGGGGEGEGQRTSKKKYPSKACEMNTNDTNQTKFLALL